MPYQGFEPKIIIRLIAEEIKSCHFFSSLRLLGLDDNFFQSDLGTIILTSLGFDEDSDEAMALYTNLLSKYAENVEHDHEVLMQKAEQFYFELQKARIHYSR